MVQKMTERDFTSNLYETDPADGAEHVPSADRRDLTFVPDAEDEAFLFGGTEGGSDLSLSHGRTWRHE